MKLNLFLLIINMILIKSLFIYQINLELLNMDFYEGYNHLQVIIKDIKHSQFYLIISLFHIIILQ